MSIVSMCDQCGRCCTKWKITLNIDDIKKLEKLGYKRDYFAEVSGGLPQFKQIKKRCIFLDKDNLCIIQKKHGFKHKPEVCKDFPYQDLVCGYPGIEKKKKKKKKHRTDVFFHISKKAIPEKIFISLLKDIETNKPLYESYCDILANILAQKDKIIIDKIKIKHNAKISRRLDKFLEEMLFEKSKSLWPSLNKLMNKKIKLKLPTRDFSIKIEKIDIPPKLRKKFLPYLTSQMSRSSMHPVKVLFILYHLPYFTNEIKQDKELDFMHVLQAFILLNSLNRFGDLDILLDYKPATLNNNLHKYISIEN